MKALDFLHDYGYISCIDGSYNADDTSISWTLLPLAWCSLKPMTRASCKGLAITSRKDIQLEDMSEVELHQMLLQQNFKAKVKYGNRVQVITTDGVQKKQKIVPYIVGGPKVFWLHWDQKAFNRVYFLALLKACAKAKEMVCADIRFVLSMCWPGLAQQRAGQICFVFFFGEEKIVGLVSAMLPKQMVQAF